MHVLNAYFEIKTDRQAKRMLCADLHACERTERSFPPCHHLRKSLTGHAQFVQISVLSFSDKWSISPSRNQRKCQMAAGAKDLWQLSSTLCGYSSLSLKVYAGFASLLSLSSLK